MTQFSTSPVARYLALADSDRNVEGPVEGVDASVPQVIPVIPAGGGGGMCLPILH